MSEAKKTLHLKYFALLKEERGLNSETIQADFVTAEELYEHLKQQHGFRMSTRLLRVSVNNKFVHWQTHLKDGDEIVFIPPVAGG